MVLVNKNVFLFVFQYSIVKQTVHKVHQQICMQDLT